MFTEYLSASAQAPGSLPVSIVSVSKGLGIYRPRSFAGARRRSQWNGMRRPPMTSTGLMQLTQH